jgi:hypothetical protein
VWRGRARAAVALTLLAAAGLLFLAPPAAFSTSAASASCPLHYAPWSLGPLPADCSVPQGSSVDPCSIVSFGKLHCPISTPDLNPADWLGFIGCQIENGIVQPLISSVEGAFNSVVGAVEGGIESVIHAVVGAVTGIISAADDVAALTGPFEPIVLVLIIGAIAVAVTLLGWLVFLGIIAVGKSVYNIL